MKKKMVMEEDTKEIIPHRISADFLHYFKYKVSYCEELQL
jgi:hypothetical protein